jgi:hypothetical protein
MERKYTKFISCKEFAQRNGISERRVRAIMENERTRIPGAHKIGHVWVIPDEEAAENT